MTSRERVLTALDHREPDRVPVDMGGTVMTGIMAQALDRYLRHSGVSGRKVKVYEVFQMLGEVELDLVEQWNLDVLPVEPPAMFFDIRRQGYKPWTLFDGTEALVPGQFDVDIAPNGDWLLHTGGDPAKPVEGRMPKDGYYFDIFDWTKFDSDWEPPSLDEVRAELTRPSDEDLRFMCDRAAYLRAHTDKALILTALDCWGLPLVGSIPESLMLLATDRDYVRELLAIRTEWALGNLAYVWQAIGDRVDLVMLSGADYGTQRAEIFSPDVFAEYFAPLYARQIDWIHANTSWKVWQHSCGSIAKLIPQMVSYGLDALNPVQTSAEGMDAAMLKTEHGDKLTFWGGGVDTQRTLPFGTPDEVRNEVRDRIRTFAPGGGFIFSAVHNIQAGTPPENIAAMFDAVRSFGTYPV
jgi:hypothetical protein